VGIAIHSPIAGSLINDFSVLVAGEFDTSLAPEVGITVNGFPARLEMETFSAIVAVGSQTTNLTAAVTNLAGNTLASHMVPITVQPSAPTLTLQPRPAEGMAPLTVTFDLTSLVPVNQLSLDANGDGTVDFQGSTLQGQTFIFQEPGLYYPTVTVMDNIGGTYSAAALIQVYDAVTFDTIIQKKWQQFKSALRAGDVAGALLFIALDERTEFQGVFLNLTVPLSSIDQVLTNIQFVQARGYTVEYEMLRTDGGTQFCYSVRFVLDKDGVWRIRDL
jgi:PKD repeat protein